MSAQDVVIMLVQCQVVLLKIGKQIIGSQNLSNLDELVIVVSSLEEWLLLEDETCEHAT